MTEDKASKRASNEMLINGLHETIKEYNEIIEELESRDVEINVDMSGNHLQLFSIVKRVILYDHLKEEDSNEAF